MAYPSGDGGGGGEGVINGGISSAIAPPYLPPPLPKSPPEYPDLYGKRKEAARVQTLEREIGFIEGEVKFMESVQSSSRCCKEVSDFVVANSDPFIPIKQKSPRPCRFMKWLCSGIPCLSLAKFCCQSECLCHLKQPKCCKCTNCNCIGSQCCECCSTTSCCCCPRPSCSCFQGCCSCSYPDRSCCIPTCFRSCARPSCLNNKKNSCCGWSSCFRCTKLRLCCCFCNCK